MKKIFTMICVAAAALVGCQNVDDMNDGALGGNNIKATASTPELTRTELVYADGAYKAQWCEGDQVALIEVATTAEGSEVVKYESNALTAAAESAVFSFNNVAAVAAENYQYVLAYPYGNVGKVNATTANLTLATSQVKKDASFGANCDLLIAKSEVLAAQPESVAFTLIRLSAVAKMTLKNFIIPAGEVVKNVTLSCEQPLTGTIGVNYADLSWSVVDGVNSVTTTNYEWTVAADGTLDVYFSVLPATLAAGESYIITVETDKATYHKVANFTSDLKFVAGDITIFSANMNDADKKAIETPIEDSLDGYYAIGYTEKGITYLLPNTATILNPALHTVGNGELEDLTIENGRITGEISDTFKWSIVANANGTYSFRCKTDYYLISCAKAQGLAVSNDGKGNYSSTYYNTFTLTAKEGGYTMKNSVENRWVQADAANNRWGQPTSAPAGTINFYRIVTPTMQESVYPVITDAAHVTKGTYVMLFKNASTDTYYTMKNGATLVAPAATAFSELNLTMKNGLIVAAGEVANEYKWVLDRTESGNLNIKSATNTARFFRQKNNAGGMGVMTNEEYEAAKETNTITGVYESAWNFINTGSGMQAVAGANERHLGVKEDGTTWAGFKAAGIIGEIVLVKLSNSTEEIQ